MLLGKDCSELVGSGPADTHLSPRTAFIILPWTDIGSSYANEKEFTNGVAFFLWGWFSELVLPSATGGDRKTDPRCLLAQSLPLSCLLRPYALPSLWQPSLDPVSLSSDRGGADEKLTICNMPVDLTFLMLALAELGDVGIPAHFQVSECFQVVLGLVRPAGDRADLAAKRLAPDSDQSLLRAESWWRLWLMCGRIGLVCRGCEPPHARHLLFHLAGRGRLEEGLRSTRRQRACGPPEECRFR